MAPIKNLLNWKRSSCFGCEWICFARRLRMSLCNLQFAVISQWNMNDIHFHWWNLSMWKDCSFWKRNHEMASWMSVVGSILNRSEPYSIAVSIKILLLLKGKTIHVKRGMKWEKEFLFGKFLVLLHKNRNEQKTNSFIFHFHQQWVHCQTCTVQNTHIWKMKRCNCSF